MMQTHDLSFWKKQLTSAKDENKKFFNEAKSCNDAYSKERSYNIFYSNVQVLKANLLANNPKPDIQRRFLKKSDSDKLKYNTYLEVSRVSEGCISYYSDVYKAQYRFKDVIEKSLKLGRGVGWIEYNPIIAVNKTEAVVAQDGAVIEEAKTEEYIKDRELKVVSLNYDEFLCSTVCDDDSIWWKARRHLMTKEELKNRFNYDAEDYELKFKEDDEVSDTKQSRAEVWEVWDKSTKTRMFILLASRKNDFLEVQEDPYKLEGFFPCKEIRWLDNGRDIIPIPEYKIYRNKAVQLDTLSQLSDNLEEVIKYVVITDAVNKDNTSELSSASEGDIVTLNQTNPMANGQIPDITSTLPIQDAISLADHREIKKQQLKSDIYDITGISDIIRGVSDPNETATAQKIKGVFGSLRFQDRQKAIQEFIKDIYQIMTEIICENWDAETMAEITCTYLPTQEEKQAIMQKQQQVQFIQQQAQSNPNIQQAIESGQLQVPQVTQDELNKLEQPTWDDLLQIMKSDKLRNYTIDIETTATVFDDMEQQNASILALNQSYQQIVATAMQFQDPTVIKGYIPIVKMQLTNIKTGRAIAKQMIEALENAVKQLEERQQQPTPPDPSIEFKQAELQLKQQDLQLRSQESQQRMKVEALRENNRSRELALKEQEKQMSLAIDEQSSTRKSMYDVGVLNDKQRQTDIKQQEADRKDAELAAEAQFKVVEIQQGVTPNVNLGGSPVV